MENLKRGSLWLLAALLGCGFAPAQTPTFELGFAGCLPEIPSDGDRAFRRHLVCTLGTRANPVPSEGAQGGSISLARQGKVLIEEITTEGTAGAPHPIGFRVGGFERSALTTPSDGDGCPDELSGAVSTVALSFTTPVTLPGEDGTLDIARLTLAGRFPFPEEPPCRDARVFYVDGCLDSGDAVNNSVT